MNFYICIHPSNYYPNQELEDFWQSGRYHLVTSQPVIPSHSSPDNHFMINCIVTVVAKDKSTFSQLSNQQASPSNKEGRNIFLRRCV